MPLEPVIYTYSPVASGSYDFYGTYATLDNGVINGEVDDTLDPSAEFAAFDSSSIAAEISILTSNENSLSAVTLSYTLSTDDFFASQTIDVGYPVYFDPTQATLVAADQTNASNSGFGTIATVSYDISDDNSATSHDVSYGSTNYSDDVTQDVLASAAAQEDFFATFSSESAAGFVKLSDVSITITGYLASDLPTVSNTLGGQIVVAGQTIAPFASVVLNDPENASGNGDAIAIIVLNSDGDGVDGLGTLSLSAADTVPGQGLTAYGGGSYTLGTVTSLATLQAELRDLVFTPYAPPDGVASQKVTFELDFQSPSGVSSNQATSVITEQSATCFLPGTRIATPGGATAVESLAIGDGVLTAAGVVKPVKWIGRRRYDGRFIAGNPLMLPIHIRAGALGPGVPQRDLHVSPGHGMMVSGVLVPAWRLVNGVSITQADQVDAVTYMHVELEGHDIILAEGAPAESFLDDGSRGRFQNASEFHALYPDAAPARRCMKRVEDGFHLQQIQQEIAWRAGIVPETRPAGRLRGYVDQAGPARVCGWAQDAGAPEEPVCLEVLVAGRRAYQVLANGYRADLRQAGLGSGCHAFSLTLPPGVTGAVHLRRASDGAMLTLTEAAARAA